MYSSARPSTRSGSPARWSQRLGSSAPRSDGLVAQQVARGIELSPVGERARAASAFRPRRRSSATSMPPARTRVGRLLDDRADAARGPRPRSPLAGVEAGQLEARRGADTGRRIWAPSQAVRAFASSPVRRVGEAQVVQHLGVVASRGPGRGARRGDRLLGALQGHGQPARGLQEAEAVREPRRGPARYVSARRPAACRSRSWVSPEHHEVAVGALVGRRRPRATAAGPAGSPTPCA